jgi:hypothetical protein
MKVTGTIQIDITESERKRIALEYLRSKYAFGLDIIVKDGNIVEELIHPRGGRFGEKVLRPATDIEISAFNIIDDIISAP